MKLLADKASIQWGAYAGFVAAAASVLLIVYPPATSTPAWDIFYLLTTAVTGVLFWYGMSRFAEKMKSALLHWAAIMMLLISIYTDAMGALFTYWPLTALSSSGDMTGSVVYGVLLPVGVVLAGVAMLNLRDKLGEIATLYGVLALAEAAILFFGYGYTLDAWVNVALFVIGGTILHRASR